MKKFLLLIVVCCSWLDVTVFANNDYQYINQYIAEIIHIVDGDTLVMRDKNGHKHKVRIANIDAPELHQASGQKSKDNIAYLMDKQVIVKVWYFDRYRREVADVFYHNQDIGLEQIENGYAWVYRNYAKKYLPQERLDLYYQAEHSVKLQRKGLWAKRDAIAPWVFRRHLKTLNGTRKTP